jgi:hypothetical protein
LAATSFTKLSLMKAAWSVLCVALMIDLAISSRPAAAQHVAVNPIATAIPIRFRRTAICISLTAPLVSGGQA